MSPHFGASVTREVLAIAVIAFPAAASVLLALLPPAKQARYRELVSIP